VPPPAANGTMKVIGLSGHVWAMAWAWPATAVPTARSASRAHRTTLGFTAFFLRLLQGGVRHRRRDGVFAALVPV
jgi:hypothetical protein